MPTDAKPPELDQPDLEAASPAPSPRRRKSSRKPRKAKAAPPEQTEAVAPVEATETVAPVEENTGPKVADLEAQLAKKDEVVAALTAKLEQAAEQLDRFRRTGGNRGARSVGGGLPAELIQEQREITEELQRAIRLWEDMQAGAALGRIEMQVTELRDFVAGRFDAIGEIGGNSSVSPPSGALLESILQEKSAPAKPAPSDDPLSAYELLKADLMGESSPAHAEPASDNNAEANAENNAEAQADEEPVVEAPAEDVPDAAAPVPIDIATASLQELQSAVETRDAYISYLIRKLRVAESATRMSGDWASLESVPDELRASLQELEKRLQDAHRIAEVENSLERARLAREAARLELLDQQLQKKMRQLGIAKSNDEDQKTVHDEPAPKKGRSWLKRLGVGRDDTDN